MSDNTSDKLVVQNSYLKWARFVFFLMFVWGLYEFLNLEPDGGPAAWYYVLSVLGIGIFGTLVTGVLASAAAEKVSASDRRTLRWVAAFVGVVLLGIAAWLRWNMSHWGDGGGRLLAIPAFLSLLAVFCGWLVWHFRR